MPQEQYWEAEQWVGVVQGLGWWEGERQIGGGKGEDEVEGEVRARDAMAKRWGRESV